MAIDQPSENKRERSSNETLRKGEVVSGRFVVSEPIGSGGMGQIYLAFQRPFNRPVALKVMHRASSSNRELVERFFQEASTVSHLAHPNTVTVYDFGRTEAGLLYIAMEMVDGVSLGAEIRRRRALPAEEAIPFTIQIAQSLGEAHHKGLIHRDLKPDNVMVCRPDGSDPFVKVLDFGIAKVLGKEKNWTEVGNIVGTPFYMAPEQAKGNDIDGRTDLYSLGCCLYEMLTGSPPFMHESPVQVLMAHQNSPPPHLPPGFDDSIDRFLQRALAKDPADRPADAAAFVAELLATLIEMRQSNSFSGYTPPPNSRATIDSPLPAELLMSPRELKRVTASQDPATAETRSMESQPVQVVESNPSREFEPNNSVPAAPPESPSSTSTPLSASSAMPWATLIVGVFLVLGSFAAGRLLSGDGDESNEAPAVADTSAAATTAEEAAERAPLEIDSDPPGAVVTIDGVPVGKAPVVHERGDEPVEVGLAMRGYEPVNVRVGPEQKKVFAPLDRSVLTIEVESPLDNTDVRIGGKDYGTIAAGTVRTFEIASPMIDLVVELQPAGYEPLVERRDIEVLKSPVALRPSVEAFVPKDDAQKPK